MSTKWMCFRKTRYIITCTHRYTPHVHTKTNSNTAHTDTHYYRYYTACETLRWQPQTHTVSSASKAHNIFVCHNPPTHTLSETQHTHRHHILIISVYQSCHLYNAQCLSVVVLCETANTTQSTGKQSQHGMPGLHGRELN